MQEKKPKSKTGFYVALTIICGICTPYIYYTMWINSYAHENAPAGMKLPDYLDLWKTLVGALVCQAVRLTTRFLSYSTFYKLSKEQKDEELRVKYAEKACKKLYSVIYFSTSAYWGWYVLKDTILLPWYLGGRLGGDYKNVTLKTIFNHVDPAIYDYSLYTFGYHFGDFMQHLLVDEYMSDFEEMLLHHIAAVALYFCYIFGNMLTIGAVFAYLHDIADIPGALCKLLNATVYQNSSAVTFVICMIFWFATRIYALPQMIYFLITECRYPPELQHFQPYITLNAVFLSVMCSLHYYWFALFFKILGRYLKTGEAKDSQNDFIKVKGSATATTGTSSPSKAKGRAEKLD